MFKQNKNHRIKIVEKYNNFFNNINSNEIIFILKMNSISVNNMNLLRKSVFQYLSDSKLCFIQSRLLKIINLKFSINNISKGLFLIKIQSDFDNCNEISDILIKHNFEIVKVITKRMIIQLNNTTLQEFYNSRYILSDIETQITSLFSR